jgi:hypothetical protein
MVLVELEYRREGHTLKGLSTLTHSLTINILDQLCGHINMEITLEFEDSDILVEFEPEFNVASNSVDIEKATWSFQDRTHSGAVASLFGSTPEYENAPTRLLPAL